MNHELELIKEIVFVDPPTKYVLQYKKPKFDKDGNPIKKQDFYLTGNLFYADRTSYHITSKIIQSCKRYLFENMPKLPELEKMNLEFEYHSMKHIDLDNKISFWRKLFLDIVKTPTPRQIENAKSRKKEIITTNTIPDDNTKYHTKCSEEFFHGEHKMVIRIYGRVKSTQTEIPFFFV